MNERGPEVTMPRRRIPAALWMTVLAIVFVLTGYAALGASIASRHGALVADVLGVADYKAPLTGFWQLSQRAPAPRGLTWDFDPGQWEWTSSGQPNMWKLIAPKYGCTVLLQKDDAPGLPQLGPDGAGASSFAQFAMLGMRLAGATVSHREAAPDAWISFDDGRVALSGTKFDFTVKDSDQKFTAFVYSRSFKSSHQHVSFLLECPEAGWKAYPSALEQTLLRARLKG
jgi:hypothetical protein